MAETVLCTGAVVRRSDSVLLVRQSPGHSLEGQWTIPWGQVEGGESPTTAALREVREEAGIVAEIEGLLGLQELPEPWPGMIGILFLCTHVEGTPTPDRRETDAAMYVRPDELDAISDVVEPLTAWMIERVFADDFSLVKANDYGPFVPSPTYL